MKDELSKSIQELIDKNLPAQAANSMRNFIEQANEEKREYEDLKAAHKTLLAENRELKNLQLTWVSLDTEASTLAAKRLQLDKLEASLTHEKALKNQEVSLVNSAKADIFTLVSLLVKNPRAVEVFSQHSFEQSYTNSAGHWVQDKPGAEINGTKETIETKDEGHPKP
jgi:hypothetical protein